MPPFPQPARHLWSSSIDGIESAPTGLRLSNRARAVPKFQLSMSISHLAILDSMDLGVEIRRPTSLAIERRQPTVIKRTSLITGPVLNRHQQSGLLASIQPRPGIAWWTSAQEPQHALHGTAI